MSNTTKEKKPVSFGLSVAVFIFVFVSILSGIMVFGTSAHMPLVISAAVAAAVGVFSGYKWSEMEEGMSETFKA